jgi:hypothetical protein
MRQVPVQFDVFNAAANAKAAREAEWRALHRRPDAQPLAAEPAGQSHRSIAWLARLARRRPAARARRAAG